MRMGVRSVSQLRHTPDNTSGRRVTTRGPFAPVINNAPGAGHDELHDCAADRSAATACRPYDRYSADRKVPRTYFCVTDQRCRTATVGRK